MGLDAYIIPFEKELTIDKLEKDINLVIEEGEDYRSISMVSNPDGWILQYSKDEEIVNYVKVGRKALPTLRYIAETYDALIGADGFFSDAGYGYVVDSRYCENEEEEKAILIGYFAGEMLQYDSEYEWSYEFKMRLENAQHEVRETYNTVVERIKAIYAAKHKRYLNDDVKRKSEEENYTPYDIVITATKKL